MTILGGILRHGRKPQCAARVRVVRGFRWFKGSTRRCPRNGRWFDPNDPKQARWYCTRHFRALHPQLWASLAEETKKASP